MKLIAVLFSLAVFFCKPTATYPLSNPTPEAGRTPSPDELAAIAAAEGVSVDYLEALSPTELAILIEAYKQGQNSMHSTPRPTPTSTLTSVEAGITPSSDELAAIAAYEGISVDYLEALSPTLLAMLIEAWKQGAI